MLRLVRREKFYEEKAVAVLRGQIRAWDRKGYRFAANLLRHFVNKRGPSEYVPTPSDIAEVKSHGLKKIKDTMWNSLPPGYRNGSQQGGYTIKFVHPGRGSVKGSNIQWFPWDSKHMFFAYFGADLNLDGKVYVTHLWKMGWFQRYREKTWWGGWMNVRLGDGFEFDKGVLENMPRLAFRAYRAGLWLERNCRYRTFYHEMKFAAQWNREYK